MPQTIHIPIEGIIGGQSDDYGYVPGFEAFMLDYFIPSQDVAKVVLHINSDGGSVTEGFAIHNKLLALRERGVEVEAIIESKAYSIATVAALGASKVVMREAALFMVHKPLVNPGQGNAHELRQFAEYLDQHEKPMLAVYMAKTGKSAEEISALLSEERFMTAAEAKAYGFIDEVIPVSIPRPQAELKAVAFYNSKPTTENKPMTEQDEKSFLAKVGVFFGLTPKAEAPAEAPQVQPEIVAASTPTDKGALYHEGETLEVGTLVFSDEALTVAAEDGEYVLESGQTAVVAEGQVTELQEATTEAPAEEAPTEQPAAVVVTQDVLAQVNALKAEVKDLKAKLTVQASATVPGSGVAPAVVPQNFSNDTAKAEPFAESARNIVNSYKRRR